VGNALTVDLPALGYVFYDDFYKALGVSNTFGPLFIESAGNGLDLMAAARVYSREEHTSGYLEGINLDAAATRVILPYSVDTEEFRTNVGIVNTGSAPANVTISLIDNHGAALGSLPVTVPAGGMVQTNNVNRLLTRNSSTSNLEGYLRLDSNQPIVAWSSQIDNRTQDPSFALGKSAGSSHLLIPSVTSMGSFKSTLVIVNLGNFASTVKIQFRDIFGALNTTFITLIPAGGFLSYSDILNQLGMRETFGPLEIDSMDGQMLLAISRVYSISHTGGYFDAID
jgi:hypothetical protein